MKFLKYTLFLSGIFLFNQHNNAQESVFKISTPLADSTSLPTESYVLNTVADSVVNYGKLFLRTPYRYGSKGSESFDCSGFTSFVYRNFGYNLAHSSSDQAQQFDTIGRENLRKGDLVFFSGRRRSRSVGHVGIVVAAKENGEFDFIHAAVRSGVVISNSQEDYYQRRFIKASRVIPDSQLFAYNANSKPVEASMEPIKVSEPTVKSKKTIPAKYHTVKSGETLSGIATKYDVSVNELKRLNKLSGSKINPKQRIKIKNSETVVVDAPQRVLVKTNSEKNTSNKDLVVQDVAETSAVQKMEIPKEHLVAKGETLSAISEKYNVTVNDLVKFNGLKSKKIQVGQTLKLLADEKELIAESSSSKSVKLKAVDAVIKGATKTYTVKSGENLISIAKANNTTVDEIVALNQLSSNSIRAGQKIELPIVVASASNLQKRQDDVDVKTYVVKYGDNLSNIAKANNTTVEVLMAQNNLQSGDVQAGQKILLPTTSVAASRMNESTEPKSMVVIDKSKATTYIVQAGDLLSDIAAETKSTVEELMALNQMSTKKLKVGQKILIPTPAAIAAKTTKADKNNSRDVTYTVKSGDSYYSIAKAYNCTMDELKAWNNKPTNKLNVGDKLIIHPHDN